MALWWKKPAYVKARKEFIAWHPYCERCGRKATTPGHTHEDYRDFELYLSAVILGKCEALCNACNLMEKKGRKPCPKCVELYKLGMAAKGPKLQFKIHYIGQDQDHCYWCRPQEEIQRSEDRKEVFKQLVKQSHKIQNAKRRAIYQEMKRK